MDTSLQAGLQAGAELFYQHLHRSLSEMERNTKDEFVLDIVLAAREYIRDKFIEYSRKEAGVTQ